MRDAWQQPARVVDALALEGWETVIDLGAGTGYFAWWLQRRAKVIAVDPVFCRELRRNGFDAVERIAEIASADLVFAANSLRFLSDEERRWTARIAPRIALIDWKPGPRPVGPAAAEEVSIEEAIGAFPGFSAGPRHDFLPYQWMIELRKK